MDPGGGGMSIYDELKRDHEAVKHLLKQIEEASEGGGKTRERLFQELKAALTAHSRAEERVFYSALKAQEETKDAALEGVEEHHVVDVLLREIDRLADDSDRWQAKFTVLKENVEHHVEEEEQEIFKKAQKLLDSDAAEALGEKFVKEKSKVLEKIG
jgi:hemerythrin superfamily protein